MANRNDHRDDWSVGAKRSHLNPDRRRIWTDEQTESIARWLGFRPGMTVVDVGCGLGFLGYTFGGYFGEGGQYVGVDQSLSLLKEAQAAEWTRSVNAVFTNGVAEALPLGDGVADVVMCQTLLIHVFDPKAVLTEMCRVLKPGGLIVCFEPDNFRTTLIPQHTSLPEPSMETQVLLFRAKLIAHEGRARLGRGDDGVGPRIPGMLYEVGIRDIDVRLRETVAMLVPPYETEPEQRLLENVRRFVFGDEQRKAREREFNEEFLAGGGSEEELRIIEQVIADQQQIGREQIKNGTFALCGVNLVYVFKGRKG